MAELEEEQYDQETARWDPDVAGAEQSAALVEVRHGTLLGGDAGAVGMDEDVFIVRTTGEMYRDYSDYISRVNQLRYPRFECPVTGKTGLRYEETLLGIRIVEQKANQFPNEAVPNLVSLIHHSTLKLGDLVNLVHKNFEGRISKGLIKLKIRQVASKATYIGAPWIVHSDLAEEYDLPTDLPSDLQEIMIAFRVGKPIKRRSIAPIEAAVPVPEAEPEIARFPMDDEKLAEFSANDPLPAMIPAPKWTIDPDLHIFHDLFMAWHFMYRFHSEIAISRFSFDEWIDAVQAPDTSPIFREVVMCLLEHIRVTTMFGKVLTKKPITELDVEQLVYVIEVLNEEHEDLLGSKLNHVDKIEESLISVDHFFRADAWIRAYLIRLLIDVALNAENIRQTIDGIVQIRYDLSQSHRQQTIEDRKELKDQKAVIKEEKAKKVPLSRQVDLVEELKKSLVEDGDIGAALPSFQALEAVTPKSRQQRLAEQKLLKEAELKQREFELEQRRVEQRVKHLQSKYISDQETRERQRDQTYLVSRFEQQIRCTPLGFDRYRNAYYWIPHCQGRLYVAQPNKGIWGWFGTADQLSECREFLNPRGVRESALLIRLSLLEPILMEELEMAERITLDQFRTPTPKRKTRAAAVVVEDELTGWTNKYRRTK